MGLDIQVVNVHFRAGSYSGFANWRRKVAEDHGFTLNEMYGFGGKKPWPNNGGIEVLLNHPDSDGEISPGDAFSLMVALKKYRDSRKLNKVEKFVTTIKGEDNYHWALVDDWIAACEESIDEEKPIIFC